MGLPDPQRDIATVRMNRPQPTQGKHIILALKRSGVFYLSNKMLFKPFRYMTSPNLATIKNSPRQFETVMIYFSDTMLLLVNAESVAVCSFLLTCSLSSTAVTKLTSHKII